jgi:NitT/TauT family transport system substrate-binding protein
MKSALTALTFAALASLAHAQDKVTFLTSWYAQAEHGGYYQASRHRHLQEVRPGRHRQDGRPAGQRGADLAAGQADFIMGKDFQTLSASRTACP